MASCTQVDNLLQAYVDGVLGHSERLILEHHVEDCRPCKALLRKHQRSSAQMFETLAEYRLPHDLSQSVLENLPEMAFQSSDMAGLNKRAKHPAVLRERLVRLVPVAAAVLLVILAGVIRENWPSSPSVSELAFGVVTHSEGVVKRFADDGASIGPANLSSLVLPGQRYETGPRSSLILALAGDTELKLNESTRVLIHENRRVRVENGQVLFDVGEAERMFKVETPSGKIIVFGTVFDVRVDRDETIVVVDEGEVQVEKAGDDSVFSVLTPGLQVTIRQGQKSLRPRSVDSAAVTRWAKDIVADQTAQAYFVEEIQPRYEKTAKATGQIVWWAQTKDNEPHALKSIIFEWVPDGYPWGYCSFDVTVLAKDAEVLFRGKIEASVFANENRTSVELLNTGNRKTKVRWIFVRAVGDYSEGTREMEFAKVTGVFQSN